METPLFTSFEELLNLGGAAARKSPPPSPILAPVESQRPLTEDEILTILSELSPPKAMLSEVRKKFLFTVREKYYYQLRRITIYPSQLPELKKMIVHDFDSSQVQPGTLVGVPAGHSIGQPATQMSLSSFHTTGGVHQSLLGLPRLDECLNVTKEPKFVKTTIHFKELVPSIAYIRENFAIKEILFGSLVTDYNYSFVPPTEEPYWYRLFETLFSPDFRSRSLHVKFRLSVEKLYLARLTLPQIAQRLEENLADVFCVYPPLVRVSHDEKSTKDVEFHVYIDTVNIAASYQPDDLYRIFLLNVAIPELINTSIAGVRKVENINIVKSRGEPTYCIEAFGGDFLEILALPYVDTYRTTTDNVWDIVRAFGIEAGRNALIHEFTKVLTADGTFIHPHHINLLVDEVIKTGEFKAVTRYGMNREEAGVLGKASFEETQKNFMLAGIFGEDDELRGVSASIMTGKLPKIGSGMFGLRMDLKPKIRARVAPPPLIITARDAQLESELDTFLEQIGGRPPTEKGVLTWVVERNNSPPESPHSGNSLNSAGSLNSVGSDFD